MPFDISTATNAVVNMQHKFIGNSKKAFALSYLSGLFFTYSFINVYKKHIAKDNIIETISGWGNCDISINHYFIHHIYQVRLSLFPLPIGKIEILGSWIPKLFYYRN